MHKKTIGSFIAVLRRASGMTQRELAERLSVSDKTVSRWERDDGLPDLTLIPLLAEIFGVSCDEILRGERLSESRQSAATASPDAPPELSEKSARQLRNIMKQTKTRLTARSMISVGLSLGGLLAAMISNFGFLRAHIGFFVGAVFFAAALLCQIAFLVRALSAVCGEEFEESALCDFKFFVARLSGGVFIGTIALFAFTLPLLTLVSDAYFGLQGNSLAEYGLLAMLLTAAALLLIYFIIERVLSSRGVFGALREPSEKSRANSRLKRKLIVIFGIIFAAVLVAQLAFNSFGYYLFPNGREFDNFEDFKEYIETKAHPSIAGTDGSRYAIDFEIISNNSDHVEINHYELGHIEIIYRNVYIDPEGVGHEWFWLNGEVLRCDWRGGSGLPVTTYTMSDIRASNNISNIINIAFVILYLAAASVCTLAYFKKRAR